MSNLNGLRRPSTSTAPQSFPTRRLSRLIEASLERSPRKTLRTFSRRYSAFINTGSAIMQSAEHRSEADRAFGARVAQTCKDLRGWVVEVEAWEWPGTFDMPCGEERWNNREQVLAEYSISPLDSLNDTIDGYWGSLPKEIVLAHEKRMDEIQEAMDRLDMEGLKSHVKSVHILPKLNSDRQTNEFVSFRVGTVDDFTALVTATVLEALPYMSWLTRLLNEWSVRLLVCRKVPVFVSGLDDMKHQLEIAAEEMSYHNLDCHSSVNTIRNQFDSLQKILGSKISALGQRLDNMLDELEGRSETLPDQWIDQFEALELTYGDWTVKSERAITALAWEFGLPSSSPSLEMSDVLGIATAGSDITGSFKKDQRASHSAAETQLSSRVESPTLGDYCEQFSTTNTTDSVSNDLDFLRTVDEISLLERTGDVLESRPTTPSRAARLLTDHLDPAGISSVDPNPMQAFDHVNIFSSKFEMQSDIATSPSRHGSDMTLMGISAASSKKGSNTGLESSKSTTLTDTENCADEKKDWSDKEVVVFDDNSGLDSFRFNSPSFPQVWSYPTSESRIDAQTSAMGCDAFEQMFVNNLADPVFDVKSPDVNALDSFFGGSSNTPSQNGRITSTRFSGNDNKHSFSPFDASNDVISEISTPALSSCTTSTHSRDVSNDSSRNFSSPHSRPLTLSCLPTFASFGSKSVARKPLPLSKDFETIREDMSPTANTFFFPPSPQFSRFPPPSSRQNSIARVASDKFNTSDTFQNTGYTAIPEIADEALIPQPPRTPTRPIKHIKRDQISLTQEEGYIDARVQDVLGQVICSSEDADQGMVLSAAEAKADSTMIYHLSQPGRSHKLKLFIRLVGSEERVMVRVGGGWMDLDEFLWQYAEHHHRVVGSGVEIERAEAISNTPITPIKSNTRKPYHHRINSSTSSATSSFMSTSSPAQFRSNPLFPKVQQQTPVHARPDSVCASLAGTPNFRAKTPSIAGSEAQRTKWVDEMITRARSGAAGRHAKSRSSDSRSSWADMGGRMGSTRRLMWRSPSITELTK